MISYNITLIIHKTRQINSMRIYFMIAWGVAVKKYDNVYRSSLKISANCFMNTEQFPDIVRIRLFNKIE